MNFPEVLKSSRVFLISLACAQPEPIEPLFNLIPLIFSSFFRVRENTQPKKPKKPANDWSSKSHNEMMDNIEKEMNDSSKSSGEKGENL